MKRSVWLVIAGGVALAVLFLAASVIGLFVWGTGPSGYGGGMMSRGLGAYGSWVGDWGFPLIGMMALGMLIPWVLVIAGVVWLVQALARSSGGSPTTLQGESPVDILKKRYSKGEITKQQFEEMKGALGSQGWPR